MEFLRQFGGKVTPDLQARYEESPNWKNGSFQNIEETPVAGNICEIPGIIYKQLSSRKEQIPSQPLPVVPFDLEAFLAPSEGAKFIWYGHSVVLMRINGKTLLIDPMLGPNTTPIAPMATKRFSPNSLDLIDTFPEIDVILLTHDHYDHLDMASIDRLKSKTKQYFVALGAGRHLEAWGVEGDRITEFDWWDEEAFADIQITYTPTRHFSGRGLTDRQKCLWGGWVFQTEAEKIWFSGDGGYGEHFKEVGRRKGPFDFAFMECGQYNDDWRPIHLFPDESVQAAIDAGVRLAMPVHWAGFPLSYQHAWHEPPEDFVVAAKEKGIPYCLPKIGEIFDGATALEEEWWKTVG